MVKLLIADDDKNLREVISTELSHKGYLTTSADSGIQAMTLLERDEYDVLLSRLIFRGDTDHRCGYAPEISNLGEAYL